MIPGAGGEVVLRATGLCKQFGELAAVDDVDLAIRRGEYHGIIGPNGAGKTTLFDCLSGALEPTAGVVEFRGEDITGLGAHERVAIGLGRSFQLTTVFDGLSVEENVRLAAQSTGFDGLSLRERFLVDKGDFGTVNQKARDILDQVGLADERETRAGSLAYGDRRRLEIGLVLATDPEIVLLDEPTSGMSGQETSTIIDLIEGALADETLLIVEHNVDLVMNISDRITVLHRGRVLAQGSPDEIAEDDDVQRAYLGGVD